MTTTVTPITMLKRQGDILVEAVNDMIPTGGTMHPVSRSWLMLSAFSEWRGLSLLNRYDVRVLAQAIFDATDGRGYLASPWEEVERLIRAIFVRFPLPEGREKAIRVVRDVFSEEHVEIANALLAASVPGPHCSF